MTAHETIDWAKELRKLSIPTLIVHGDRDPFYDTETMRYVHSLIPNSELVVFEGSGHLPAMTRPLEVAKAINEFFGSVPGNTEVS